MSYCKHFEDRGGWFSLRAICNVEGSGKYEKNIPQSYLDQYCKNDGYKCPWYEKQYGSSGGCFITTISCNILKKEDNDRVMEGLRKFRDEVLQKDEKYSDILKLYDGIGPVVATAIEHDSNKEEKASQIYSKLEHISDLTLDGKYESAINNYVILTLKLVSEYKIQGFYRRVRDNNFGFSDAEFNLKTAGHGRKITKTLEK